MVMVVLGKGFNIYKYDFQFHQTQLSTLIIKGAPNG